jgi:hypothetical protein
MIILEIILVLLQLVLLRIIVITGGEQSHLNRIIGRRLDRLEDDSLATFREHLATIENERAAHQREMLEADMERARDPFYVPKPGAEGGER